MKYKKISRVFSEDRLKELRSRIICLIDAGSSYEQIGGYKILPGLFDDLLHDERILNMVRREMGIPDLLPSICSGDYFPPASDMPLSIGDDSTNYQLIIQLNENESWALNRFTEEGEVEEVVLGMGEAVLINSLEVTSGRMVTPSDQYQAKLCYVDASSPNAFLGISNYQRSSLREYRKYNV